MLINAGLDTGDILLQSETPIGVEENSVELNARLSLIGARLLIETLDLLQQGACPTQTADRSGCDTGQNPAQGRWPDRLAQFRARDRQSLARLPALARHVDVVSGSALQPLEVPPSIFHRVDGG